MNAHEFINNELELDLNNSYVLIEEEIIGMFDERNDATDNEPTKEIDNVQISDVLVNKVRFKDVENALVTFKQNLEQRPTNVTPLIQRI